MRIDLALANDPRWTPLLQRHAFADWQTRFATPRSQEHYLFLAYLGARFVGRELWDMGTSTGLSACALALCGSNMVHTVDVSRIEQRCDYGDLPIEEHDGSCLEFAERAAKSPLILLDIDHLGETERGFVRMLRGFGFRGLLVMDDVRVAAPVRAVAEEIAADGVPMWDLSSWAHSAGTALLDFGCELTVVDPWGQCVPPVNRIWE